MAWLHGNVPMEATCFSQVTIPCDIAKSMLCLLKGSKYTLKSRAAQALDYT